MDDRNFDEQTAQLWIDTVEGDRTRVRDADIYPRLRTWLAAEPTQSVLEIGCGQGVCSAALELGNRHYTGVDPSPFLIRRARELYEAREFIEGNAYALPIETGAIDAAYSVAVWHLLADLPRAAAELTRVLRPGGRYLIISANPDAYEAWTAPFTDTRVEGRRFEGSWRLPDGSMITDVLYLHRLEEILGSLRAAGLEVDPPETLRPLEKLQGRGALISLQGRKPG